ncbi:hypothetical protein [uncultured Acetatifactor sp.]|jgi:hypothetical protein|uniref:hypothetical protein n=1 Tax=uncultured Acetatifactor sp. TaxID=1671927 RepID=UPI0026280933|nr:hypothetical protein [uncultured Acetatifactor sp.]MCI8697150.1 hypothetical protein [Lachnospiraceae bacterium]
MREEGSRDSAEIPGQAKGKSHRTARAEAAGGQTAGRPAVRKTVRKMITAHRKGAEKR